MIYYFRCFLRDEEARRSRWLLPDSITAFAIARLLVADVARGADPDLCGVPVLPGVAARDGVAARFAEEVTFLGSGAGVSSICAFTMWQYEDQ
jgi:hypothetical protein